MMDTIPVVTQNVKLAGLLHRRDHAFCKRGEKRVVVHEDYDFYGTEDDLFSPSFPRLPREARAHNGGSRASMETSKPVAVDEDLYKIPPELIFHCRTTKRKRVLGFFSRCLAPACTA